MDLLRWKYEVEKLNYLIYLYIKEIKIKKLTEKRISEYNIDNDHTIIDFIFLHL